MKAGRIHAFVPPNTIVIDELPHPTPEEGETALPLEKVRKAHEMLAGAPHKRGKIVLTMDGAR